MFFKKSHTTEDPIISFKQNLINLTLASEDSKDKLNQDNLKKFQQEELTRDQLVEKLSIEWFPELFGFYLIKMEELAKTGVNSYRLEAKMPIHWLNNKSYPESLKNLIYQKCLTWILDNLKKQNISIFTQDSCGRTYHTIDWMA